MKRALSAYLRSLEDRPSLHAAAVIWLDMFTRHARAQVLDWRQLTREDLEDYRHTLRWEPNRRGQLYAPATVTQPLFQLRHFLRWAHARGDLVRDPSQGWVVGSAPHRQPVLSPAQLVELVGTPDAGSPLGQRDGLLLELVATLELGVGRCLALDLADMARLPGRPRLERYLREGRPALLHNAREPALFLTQTGERLGVGRAGQLPGQYARQLGWESRVNLQMLARSFRAHQADFSRGLFSF